MEIDSTNSLRARTKVLYLGKTITDQCVIFPDELNDGHYIALSETTSKVGWGEAINDAYVDLLVGISTAFKYALDNNLEKEIGLPSNHEIWRDEGYLKSIHRLDGNEQKGLIECVKSLIEEKCGELRKPTHRNVSIIKEKSAETQIDIEAILDVA